MTRNPLHSRRFPHLEVRTRLPARDEGRPPLLFVHGLGHAAWCWEHWLDAAATAGHPAHAVSLRGHGASAGSLRSAHLDAYVDDVVRTAASLSRRAVLVGHSLGGLVVQRALARYGAHAGVLVAPVPAHTGVASLLNIGRQHPQDALAVLMGRTLPLRAEYLFAGLEDSEAQRQSRRCGRESALAQYQIVFHRPAPQPRGDAPVLVLATPQDRLVPIAGVRATARRYGADLREFPGMGHDLMLDAGWAKPCNAMTEWLRTARST